MTMRHHKATCLIAALLFLFGQAYLFAHSLEHAGEPEHEDTDCEICLIIGVAGSVEPPTKVEAPTPYQYIVAFSALPGKPNFTKDSSTEPARGPPTFLLS